MLTSQDWNATLHNLCGEVLVVWGAFQIFKFEVQVSCPRQISRGQDAPPKLFLPVRTYAIDH